jgi:hypothetical protein
MSAIPCVLVLPLIFHYHTSLVYVSNNVKNISINISHVTILKSINWCRWFWTLSISSYFLSMPIKISISVIQLCILGLGFCASLYTIMEWYNFQHEYMHSTTSIVIIVVTTSLDMITCQFYVLYSFFVHYLCLKFRFLQSRFKMPHEQQRKGTRKKLGDISILNFQHISLSCMIIMR